MCLKKKTQTTQQQNEVSKNKIRKDLSCCMDSALNGGLREKSSKW